MTGELVSIIIPVYNVEDYLDQCLDSVINQTYSNIEIIIINDGSTDNSYYICQEYAIKDPRIILLSQKNEGVSSARNKGILYSHGEYITFIDSDDYIELDYIEHLANAIMKNVDLVAIHFGFKDGFSPCVITNQSQMARLFTKFGYTWGKLIRKKCIKDLFCVELQFAEDFIFYINLLKSLRAILVVNYNGYHYRIRIGSLTSKDPKEFHTLEEFNRKYSFVMFYQKNIENFRIYDIEIQKIINSHYYYICCLIILLSYKLSKTKIDIERKKSLLLKIMRQNYSCFFAISGIRDKKWKRVLFGSILLIFPYYGALISEKIINELR